MKPRNCLSAALSILLAASTLACGENGRDSLDADDREDSDALAPLATIDMVLETFADSDYAICDEENKDRDALCNRTTVRAGTDRATARILLGRAIPEFSRRLHLPDTNRFARYGSSSGFCSGDERGDLDFAYMNYLRTVYTALRHPGVWDESGAASRETSSYLSDEDLHKIIFDILPVEGDSFFRRFDCSIDTKVVGVVDVKLLDTENHILMTNIGRYLNNQLIYDCPQVLGDASLCPEWYDDARYDNQRNDMPERLAELLQEYLRNHFEEYNSKPYQGYTTLALTVLQAFADDDYIRELATMNLEVLAQQMAIQSNGLRRHSPFRRHPKYADDSRASVGDREMERYSIAFGSYEGLVNPAASLDEATHMMLTAATSAAIAYHTEERGYLPTYETRHLALAKGFEPIYQSLRHTNLEVYSASSSLTISAGGSYDEQDVPAAITIREEVPVIGGIIADIIDSRDDDKQDGWARPTTLMPTSDPSEDYLEYVRFEGHHDSKRRSNTCVGPHVACGINVEVPGKYDACLVSEAGPWRFYDLDDCGLGYGYYMALYRSPCTSSACQSATAGGSGDYGIVEVREASEMSFEAFREAVLARTNGGGDRYESEGVQSYTSTRDDIIDFEINPEFGRTSIRSVLRAARGLRRYDSDRQRWPMAEGDAMHSSKPGLVALDNPMLGHRWLLDATDFRNPRWLAGARPVIATSPSYGGSGGDYFDSSGGLLADSKIRYVRIEAGERVDAIRFDVSQDIRFEFGGGTSTYEELSLADDEYLVEARISDESGRVHSLALLTNQGRTVRGGKVRANERVLRAPPGYQIAGFFGRSGSEIDRLGVVFTPIAADNQVPAPITPLIYANSHGGSGGTPFDDGTQIPSGARLTRIEVNDGSRVDGITFIYSDGTRLGHGSQGADEAISLGPDEHIAEVYISTVNPAFRSKRVSSVRFVTSDGRELRAGTVRTERAFVVPSGWQVTAMHGRAGNEMDRLGMIATPI